jgi:hypothetical protein
MMLWSTHAPRLQQGFNTVFGPTIDCVEVTASPLNLLKKGQYFGGPALLGSNGAEAALRLQTVDTIRPEEYSGWLQQNARPPFATSSYANR